MIRPFHNKILEIVSEKYVHLLQPSSNGLGSKNPGTYTGKKSQTSICIAHSSHFVLVCISYCFEGHLEFSFISSLHAMHFSLCRNNLLLLAPF